MKPLNKKEIEAIVDKKIRELLSQLKISGEIVVPGKKGRPVGYSPKKKQKKN